MVQHSLNNAKTTLAYFVDLKPDPGNFLEEVVLGFSNKPKSISPKFFYDTRGSDLFNKICQTPEYYITRTEISLLEEIGPEISKLVGKEKIVIEYGCGSSHKINTLLGILEEPLEYLAIDISHSHLRKTAEEIALNFPDVKVGALCADFLDDFNLPSDVGAKSGGRLVFFPGSTIGNQHPEEAMQFMRKVHRVVGVDGVFLVGVDQKKDKSRLEQAYNDSAGYTSAFNLNLIKRMRDELKILIDENNFKHVAIFNEKENRIEMHLMSTKAQTITIKEESFSFELGETIHTENSYKYSPQEFAAMSAKSGFKVINVWSDRHDLFAIYYLKAV